MEVLLRDVSSNINILVRKAKVVRLHSKYPMYCISNHSTSITIFSSKEAYEASKALNVKVFEVINPPQFRSLLVIPNIPLN
ncbi:MAG: hypothetical protein MRT15_08940 [archaeon YNP-LCB-003-016]|uniref:hypothetical protein n=1 Tax=Candidatus Culexarchaeum yellowstonense TaxID=2928963 RepID=UPI0026E9C260|nr:hypothetical protein [Candidatus Culexarchaeum yellowstonense]MCR6692504.1 hypothetical protein [Candidatus Culexarchaeum yellowstonense]